MTGAGGVVTELEMADGAHKIGQQKCFPKWQIIWTTLIPGCVYTRSHIRGALTVMAMLRINGKCGRYVRNILELSDK